MSETPNQPTSALKTVRDVMALAALVGLAGVLTVPTGLIGKTKPLGDEDLKACEEALEGLPFELKRGFNDMLIECLEQQEGAFVRCPTFEAEGRECETLETYTAFIKWMAKKGGGPGPFPESE